MKRFSSVLIGIAAAAATYAALWFTAGQRHCNYNYYGHHRYSHHAHYGHHGHYNHCDYNRNQFSDSAKTVN
ncbi:MAG TPA: hypothetical protein VEC12_00525 [Bacteroidia bacterium]|nr:hypothetical protein [Bacteroidia bacterium]